MFFAVQSYGRTTTVPLCSIKQPAGQGYRGDCCSAGGRWPRLHLDGGCAVRFRRPPRSGRHGEGVGPAAARHLLPGDSSADGPNQRNGRAAHHAVRRFGRRKDPTSACGVWRMAGPCESSVVQRVTLSATSSPPLAVTFTIATPPPPPPPPPRCTRAYPSNRPLDSR